MTLGNNDTKYHYQPPFGDDKQTFYEFLDDVWFYEHTGNQQLDNLDEIQETLDEGGWYRANLIPGKLTLLSFDSLSLNKNNEQQDDDEIDA